MQKRPHRSPCPAGSPKRASQRGTRLKIQVLACLAGASLARGQVQNISAWTLETSDSADVTVGGITYLNNWATPLTVTTSVGTYNAGTAGAGADNVFIRRNTATATSTANVAGQAVSVLSASSGSSTVYGTYNATMEDLLLGGNILNSTWDTFANTSSGAGNVGHNIERVDFVWSNGYTTVGDEVIIVFNFDPVGAQDDFRVAVFTGIDNSASKLPTAYANTGVLVTGTDYPDKLPLPLSGSPTTSTSTGFRTTGTDNLSGTALNRGDSQTVGIGGVAISLATLGISPGQTIYGYSLIPTDANASTAANLLDFTNPSLYPTNTANADATGTADFSTFGGRIATITTSIGSAAFEWDGGAGTGTWGTLIGGESNQNWYSSATAENNRSPFRDGDILFGTKPASATPAIDLNNNVEVRSLTFDSGKNYTVGTSGETYTITLGDPNLAGSPSINVNSTSGGYGQNKINSNLLLVEDLSVNNNSFSTLCLNGSIETLSSLSPKGNDITVTGYGAVNFNGDISGPGDLIKNGSGFATINNNNSDDPAGTTTQWTGNIAVNNGLLVVTTDGALGGAVTRTNNLARSSGNTTLQVADASATDLKVGQLVSGTGIPAGTFITALSTSGGNTTITLSQALTGPITNTATITFAGATTVNSGGTLAFRGGVTYNTAETITLNGSGYTRGSEIAGALHNDGGDNTLGSSVSLRLGSNAAIGSRDDNLTINGVISEAGSGRSLTKTGPGVVTLAGANTYTGATIVQNGVLRLTNASAISASSNLQLAGGVLELGAGNYTAALGTGGGQVRFTSDGGFSAYGAARTVNLGGGTALTWASTAGFLGAGKALLLSSDYANNTVTFQNAIDLAATGVTGQREIRVANGSAAIDAVLSGNLTDTGTGGLVKTGAGTLNLTGANNYIGATEIKAGALRGNVSANSNLQLNGGVREVSANTALNLGTAGGNVQWTGSGGFAAAGGAYTLNLNSGAALTWGTGGTTGFTGATGTLTFGSLSADNTLTLTNALALGGTSSDTRTIQTIQGTGATVASGALSGIVSGAAGLALTGNGRLDLTANNTHTGAVTVTGSELRLSGANGDLAQSSGFVVRQGGILTADNTSANLADRLGDSAAISLQGGTVNLYGRTGNNDTADTIGAVTLASGANTINAGYGDNTGSAQLTLSGLSRTAGATVNFTNLTAAGAAAGTLGSTGDNSRILVTGLANTNGIVGGWATAGDNWAYEISDTQGIAALGTYETSSTPANWGTTENISIAAAATNDASRTVNSFRLDGSSAAQTLDLDNDTNARTLTLASGGILSVGASTNVIKADNAGSILRASGAGDLIVHTQGSSNTLQINAQIGNNTGGNGLTKAGDGALQLGGTMANSYTGVTTVNAGTLVLGKTAGVNAIAGDGNTATNDLIVGDGRGIDTVRLAANEQIANDASVLLKGGEVGNAANVARLELNGAVSITDSSRIETFRSLDVSGNTVLDFGGGTVCSPTLLYLDFLNVGASSLLTITNWVEFTDFLLVKKVNFDPTDLPRIVFDGYETTAGWKDYDSNYYQITPVPEPATYGALALGSLTAFALYRRRRRAVLPQPV